MAIYNGINIRNIILIYLYYIFSSIKQVFCEALIDMKKLSLYDSYFVALDTGLYLYAFNTNDCALIYKFNNEIKVSSTTTNITELYDGKNGYIFCLIQEHLFIFNENTNKTFNFKINEITTSAYYNIMPYKVENNNISFILAFNNDKSNLIFYYYDFNLYEDISEPKEIKFSDMNIQNKMIRCQLNSYLSFIKCFYYSKINNINYLFYSKFSIEDKNINIEETLNISVNETINQIKMEMSYDNNFFICFLLNGIPSCHINFFETNNLTKINCIFNTSYGDRYKVLYFNETQDFMFISEYHLTTTLFSNFNYSVEICRKNIFSEQTKQYYIINYFFSLIFLYIYM